MPQFEVEIADEVGSLNGMAIQQDQVADDYSQDESMGLQTHDEDTPRQNFSSSLRASMLSSPSGGAGSALKGINEQRMSPLLRNSRAGKEPLLKGLKLHKIGRLGQSPATSN